MRTFSYSLAVLCLWAATARAQEPMADVLKAESDRVTVVAKAKPTVVAVFARGGQGGGTGVLINEEGFALTNFHVVQPTGALMQCGLADGVLYDGVLVGWDKVGDVALIKLLPKKVGDKQFPQGGKTPEGKALPEGKFPYAALANSDLVKQGDWSIAMGNPFLLATDFTPTVTFGLVSGVNRYQPPAGIFLEYTDCIQIDTSINPGNSGGPLFNLKGEVIGINGRGSFDKRGRVNSGVGYAISINQIKNFMGHLRAGLDVDHASLGALVRTETADKGILRTTVTTILEEADAARRGLDVGDELVSFVGRRVTSDNHYKNVVGLFPRGWRVPLAYRRGDAEKEILVRLMGVQRKEIADGPPKDAPKPKIGPAPKGPPSEAAKYYEPKPGFVNHYFNKQEKKRVFTGLAKISDLSAAKGAWSFDGDVRLKFLRTTSPFSAEVDGAGKGMVSLKIGAFPEKIEPFDPNITQADLRKPKTSGGFLAALYVWRQLLVKGEDALSDCVAAGMEPLYPPPVDGSPVKNWIDQRVDADIITGRTGTYMTKWFFDRKDQKILGFELRMGDANEDPCEVYFSDYRPVNGKLLPHRIMVYYQDVPYGNFEVKNYKLPAN